MVLIHLSVVALSGERIIKILHYKTDHLYAACG